MRPFALALSILLGVGSPAPSPAANGVASAPPAPTLTVVSLNLFVGLDVAPIFAATTPAEFQQAAAAGWANVQATDFNTRAEALARLIDDADADVIGLQEAVLWTSGPLLDPAIAREVEYDFLEILVDALAARGMIFRVAEVVDNLALEAPVLAAGRDLRVLDRDALLVRDRPGNQELKVVGSVSGRFATLLPFSFLGTSLEYPRGWVAVDLKHRGQTIRFVNTHLEALAPAVRDAQASELVSGILAGEGPAVLLGDLNAEADGTAPGTYGRLNLAGFADPWLELEAADPGWTCCHAPALTGPSGLAERIDYVLLRSAPSIDVSAVDADLIGDEGADRTAVGTWPSDHAGVVVEVGIRGSP